MKCMDGGLGKQNKTKYMKCMDGENKTKYMKCMDGEVHARHLC